MRNSKLAAGHLAVPNYRPPPQQRSASEPNCLVISENKVLYGSLPHPSSIASLLEHEPQTPWGRKELAEAFNDTPCPAALPRRDAPEAEERPHPPATSQISPSTSSEGT